MASFNPHISNEGSERVQQIRHWYDEASSAHDDWLVNAERNRRYFWGDQWSPADRNRAAVSGRPIVTIPIVKPMIKLVIGMQMSNPVEIQCSPRDGGDFLVAQQYTDLIKYIGDTNELTSVDGVVFADGIITGRGFYVVDIDYSKDIVNGRIIVREEDSRNVVLDPNGRWYGGRQDNFRMRVRWLTRSQINSIYGQDKSDGLTRELMIEKYPADYKPHYEPTGEFESFKVIECNHKEYRQKQTIFDMESGQSWPVRDDGTVDMSEMGIQDPVDSAEFMAQYGGRRFELVKRKVPKMMITTISAHKELAHGESPFNDSEYCEDMFNIIPYQPLYMHGKSGSIVDDLIDLQRGENLAHSQMLHMINQSANSGWVVERGAMVNPNDLKEYGSAPGVVLEMMENKMYGQHLNRLDPGKIPQLDRLVPYRQLAQEATNITPNMLGQKEGSDSGRAIALKVQQGTTALLPDVAPYLRSKRMLGRYILGAVQAKMPLEQAYRITGDAFKEYLPMQVRQQEDMVKQIYSQFLSDNDAAKYDCIAHEVPKSETRRQANWEKFVELFQMYGPEAAPFQTAVEIGDFPNKELLLENFRMQQQMVQQQQAMMQGGGPPGPGGAPPPGGPPPGGPPRGPQANPMANQLGNMVPPRDLGVKPSDMQNRQDGSRA